jgi:hypothetical protein
MAKKKGKCAPGWGLLVVGVGLFDAAKQGGDWSIIFLFFLKPFILKISSDVRICNVLRGLPTVLRVWTSHPLDFTLTVFVWSLGNVLKQPQLVAFVRVTFIFQVCAFYAIVVVLVGLPLVVWALGFPLLLLGPRFFI